MNSAISAFIWCAVQVTALTFAVTLVYLAARRLHPRAGATAAGGGLLMVLALTLMVASPWPRWELADSGDLNGAQPRTATAGDTPPSDESLNQTSAISDLRARIAREEAQSPTFWALLTNALNHAGDGALSSHGSETVAKPQAAGVRWRQLIAFVFLAGGMVAAVRFAWGVASVWRLARSGHLVGDSDLEKIVQEMHDRLALPCPVTIRESNELATPATVGWRRPVVLLPTSWREWSDTERRAVIAHELAHIAGHDYVAWLIARLAVAAHFYHPLVRWLAARLQLEQEQGADMTAARLLGDSKVYLRSLASLALATPAHRMSGPARTLFPSRSLLVRRVEMLRTSTMNRPRRGIAHYATFALVALLGLVAAGLRGPGMHLSSAAHAQFNENDRPAKTQSKEDTEQLSAELVLVDTAYVVYVPVARILDDERLSRLVEQLRRVLVKNSLNADDAKIIDTVDEAMMIGPASLSKNGSHRWVLRTRTAEQLDHVITRWRTEAQSETIDIEGSEIVVAPDGEIVLRKLDSRTIVFDYVPDGFVDGKWKGKLPPLKHAPPAWQKIWDDKVQSGVVLAAMNIKNAAPNPKPEQLGVAAPQSFPDVVKLFTLPIEQNADWAVVNLEIEKELRSSATFESGSNEAAVRVRDAIQSMIAAAQSVVTQLMAAADRADEPQDVDAREMIGLYKQFGQIAQELLANAKVEAEGQRVSASVTSNTSTTDIAKLVADISPMVEQARHAAEETASINNLRNLVLAILMYEKENKAYPPAAGLTYRVNGEVRRSEHPHSWRVALLPYLDQQKLYDEYHFDEPWDSEANKKVLAQIPDVLRSPHDDAGSTNTSYFVFTGPDTLFPPEGGVRVSRVSDGTSRTFALVEAKRPVPWTKPEDIEYAADQPAPKLEGWLPGKFFAAIADGSVRTVAADIDEATLRAWITKAGREKSDELPGPR